MTLPRLILTPDRRRLQTENGEPFFYLADTVWELFHCSTREDAGLLLADRAARGFNVIQAVALAEHDGLRAPNSYGHIPFQGDGLDPLKPNEPYWEHVDWVVNRANELGIYVALLPTWGDKWNRAAWGIGPEIFTPENARLYAEWIGARYKDAGVIWVTGGDRPILNDRAEAIIRAFGEGLRKADGGRNLITFHPPGGASSSRYVHAEPWLDFHMLQTGHDRNRASWAMIDHDWDLRPVRPFVNAEPPYEAHPNAFRGGDAGWIDQVDIRRELYWAVLGGAAGFTYGCHAIWQMWQPGREPKNMPRAFWKESLSLPGSSEVQHGKKLALSRLCAGRRAATRGILTGLGEGPDRAYACAAEDRTWFIAYLPIGQRVRIDAKNYLEGPRVATTWFNPRTGETAEGGIQEHADVMAFQAPYDPSGRDWVLILDTV